VEVCEGHEHYLVWVVDLVETQRKGERGENTDNYHARFSRLQDQFKWGTSILKIGNEYNMVLGQEGAERNAQGLVEGDHPHHH